MNEISKTSILNHITRIKPFLTSTFGVNRIGLFGSYATNNATHASDIDLLVEFKSEIHLSYKQWLELESYLQEQLAFTKIELIDSRYLNPIIRLSSKDSTIYV